MHQSVRLMKLLRGAAPVSVAFVLGAAVSSRLLGEASHAGFSPDAQRIVTAWPGGRGSVDVAIVDGNAGSVHLLGAASRTGSAVWSPDGRWIVFCAYEGAQDVTKLYDARSGSARTISRTFGPPYAWREDSRRLAGVSLPETTQGTPPREEQAGLQVVFYNASERGESLRVPVDVASVSEMVWIPETDDVAFVGRQGTRADVYAVEGGQTHRLTTTGDVLALNLVPSRHELVWARSSKNTRYILLSLYAFDLHARSVRRLGFPDRVAQINPKPSSSPVAVDRVAIDRTGARIAVVVSDPVRSDPKAKRQVQTQRLFTVRTDGTGARLVRTITHSQGTARQQSLAPFWSMDGKRLGVLHTEADQVSLIEYAADGSGGRVIARSGADG